MPLLVCILHALQFIKKLVCGKGLHEPFFRASPAGTTETGLLIKELAVARKLDF